MAGPRYFVVALALAFFQFTYSGSMLTAAAAGEEEADYAQREAAAPDVAKFAGGQTSTTETFDPTGFVIGVVLFVLFLWLILVAVGGGGGGSDYQPDPSPGYTPSNPSSGSSPSRCVFCSGTGKQKHQDRWGTENGRLVDEWHWETCHMCKGTGWSR